MTLLIDVLARNRFWPAATLREDETEEFRFDYSPDVREAQNVVYVAVQDVVERPIYVGRARNFRARYGYDHIRWLRGEKTNSESQRKRWVEVIYRAPVHFYVRVENGLLDHVEPRLIGLLQPELNMTGIGMRPITLTETTIL